MKKIIGLMCALALHVNAQDIYATFSVEAIQSANLSFDSSGIVKDIKVEIGSSVKKGDILATLDPAEKKAQLNVSSITHKYALADYERQKKIKKIIDKETFDKYASAYEGAKANLLLKQVTLDKTYLKAPFDGVIFSKSVEVGDLVVSQAAKTLLQIQSIHDAKLVLEFDSKYWNNVKVGDMFTYTLDGDTQTYEAKITKIYPTIDQEKRTLSAEVLVQNVPIGLFGTGTITTKK